MMNLRQGTGVLVGCVLLLGANAGRAQDWPQWRGPNRDNKVTGFTAPKEWPKSLTKKWTTRVGTGHASPVLAGDKIYTLSRQGGDEVISCLDPSDGKVVWQDKYATQPATGAAGGIHAGPRSTPAVAEGKVCTLGVRGILSCLDAATGKVMWRKDSRAWPKFYISSSPLIVDGKCIAFLGGQGSGRLVAYDLASGEEKWKWTGDGPAYGSPVLMTVEGTTLVVTPTARALVGVGAADGKLLWRLAFAGKYNSGTPVVDGPTVIFSSMGAGTVAAKVEKGPDGFTVKQLWRKTLAAHRYNTPVLKDGLLFGLTGRQNFFCMNAQTGATLWTDDTERGECGTILNADSVLLALTSDSWLVVFQPSDKGYAEVTRYRVSDTPTWGCPIVAGNRVFVKGRDTVTLWTID